jgi:hypothetical protein
MMEVLEDKNILSRMDEFDKIFEDIPIFVLWGTCMKMVETQLDLIRANRDGNWFFHLHSFASMLPWMTIYDHTNYARWGTIYLAEMMNLESAIKFQ